MAVEFLVVDTVKVLCTVMPKGCLEPANFSTSFAPRSSSEEFEMDIMVDREFSCAPSLISSPTPWSSSSLFDTSMLSVRKIRAVNVWNVGLESPVGLFIVDRSKIGLL